MIRIIREDPDSLPPQRERQPEPEPERPSKGSIPPVAKLLGIVGAVMVAALAAIVLMGSGGSSGSAADATATVTPRPTSTPTPQAQGLRRQAEAQYLPNMSTALAELVRRQPWYAELTPAKSALVAGLLKCEQAAKSRGEPKAVADMLQLATEQGWYTDGLDDREAKGLTGVIQAYERSLTKSDAPPVGPVISSTIRNQLFDVVTLPETGDKVVVVASQDAALGRKTLQIATENMPKVEAVIGKFPYPFIYIEVVKDLPPEIGGLQYDEFIAVSARYVNGEVIAHELTHATLYGIFPVWFEEGVAYFMGNYVTDHLDAGAASAAADLRQIRATNRVDIINYGYYTEWDYFAETRRGFLFVKSIYDIQGPEAFGKMLRTLRTKTYNDNELLTAILQLSSDDQQTAMKKLFCDRVIGTIRNYCIGG